eukprot:6488844-Amphidinium_carterae.2
MTAGTQSSKHHPAARLEEVIHAKGRKTNFGNQCAKILYVDYHPKSVQQVINEMSVAIRGTPARGPSATRLSSP